jgi:hypothetical protein
MHISRMNPIFSAILGLFIFCTPVITSAQDKPKDDVNATSTVTVPGTEVTLTLPDVFQYNTTQAAYIYAGAAASIAIKEMNGTSYSTLSRSMTKGYIESQGMKYIESSEINTAAGMKGTLYVVQFSAQGLEDKKNVDFERMMFFTGNDTKSVWITMNYPVITKSLLESVLRESLMTIKF